VIAVHNVPDELKNAELRPGEGVGSLVIATGQPVVVNDLPRWEKRAPVFNKMNLPYDAILSVPLRWQGELFGALSLVDRGERRPFTNDDVQLLSLFADLASIALKKADLYFEITQLSQDLERKVAERTEELGLARDELAQKAEQLQQLLANMIHIQEEERTRIALDLHDESNQLITAALYEIQAGQESIRGERHAAALGKLETAKELLRRLETENRRIITGLRPPMLDSQGLIATLKWHAEAFQEHSHIPCRVQVYGRPIRLSSPTVETAVYRVVQESLNNVAAHAQARNVSLLVQFGPEELRLIIEDDGVGFDYDRTVSHTSSQMGLIGIRERVQSIGGHIDIFSTPGGGTRIALKIPVNDHSVTLERDEHYFRTRS
jgi:signal transduction histidine kinase